MQDTPIVIEHTFNVPSAKIWKALSDKKEMAKWYFDLEDFEPVVGFEFQFYAGKNEKKYLHICKVTQVVEGKLIAYTWRYEGHEGESVVKFELFPDGKSTRLKLIHEGIGTFPKNNSDLAKENLEKGWNTIIGSSLKKYLEKK